MKIFSKTFNSIISFLLTVCILLLYSQNFIIAYSESNKSISYSINYGDICEDGNINVKDGIYLIGYLLNNSTYTTKNDFNISLADISADNIIDIRDLTVLKKYLLGIIDYFPAQKNELNSILTTINNNRNIELQMSVDMLNIASNSTPLSVYEYVKNNINYEFYWGSKKGAIGTFEQLGGNDIDQASLLISLLTYLGYKANYVTGIIELTPQQAIDWTSADDVQSALNIISLQTNVSATSNTVQIEHTWVEVIIDGQTVQLDPSFKKYIKNQNVIFDNVEDYGISEQDLYDSSLEGNIYGFNQSLKQSQNNCIQTPISIKSKIILKEDLNILPSKLSYTVISKEKSFDSIDNNNSNLISLCLDSSNNLITLKTAQIYSKKLTVEYTIYDEWAEALGTSSEFNNIFDINQNSNLKLKPIIKLDNKILLKGTPIKLDAFTSLAIGIKTGINNIETFSKQLKPGSMYNINFDMGNISSNQLDDAYSNVSNLTNTVNSNNIYSNEYMGNLLNLASNLYFSQLDLNNHMISEVNNIYNCHKVSVCVTGFELEITTTSIFGLENTKLNDNGYFVIDVIGQSYNTVSLNNDEESLKLYKASSGMSSSALENTIWRQVTGIQSISTTRILERAEAENIDILMISSANANIELPKIKNVIDNDSYNEILNDINNNQIITIPSQLININGWTGTGYIIMDGTTGNASYKITDNLNGGRTSDLVTLAYCVNIFCDIYDIADSIWLIEAAIIAMAAGGMLVGGAMLVLGVVGLCSAMMSYLDNIDLMCEYMSGNEIAGKQIMSNAVMNAVMGMASYGINCVVKEYAIPAIKNKLAGGTDRIYDYGKDFVEDMAKYPDFISHPDGTLEAFNKFGDYITDIVDISANNTGFDIIVTDYTDDIMSIITKQGVDILSKSAMEIVTYGETAIEIIRDNGEPAVDAIAIYGKEIIDAQINGDTPTISNMIVEANKLNSELDNINTGKKGTLYTGSIFTITDKSEENINKVAKATANKLVQMIKNEEIVRTNNKPLNISAISVAIDSSTGKIYYGLSGSNSNPTRNLSTTNSKIKDRIDSVKKWAIDKNNGEIPLTRGTDNDKALKNCAEFNAINNALNNKSDISNLYVYTLHYSNQCTFPPCYNCQALYLRYIKEFINFNTDSEEYYDRFDYNNY